MKTMYIGVLTKPVAEQNVNGMLSVKRLCTQQQHASYHYSFHTIFYSLMYLFKRHGLAVRCVFGSVT